MRTLIYVVIVVLFVGWLLASYEYHIGGHAINILIVLAVILLSYNLVSGGPSIYRRNR